MEYSQSRRRKCLSCIPEELEEEIQVRLSVKCLTKLKSVCKTWRSRFESRSFIDYYTLRNPSDYPEQVVATPIDGGKLEESVSAYVQEGDPNSTTPILPLEMTALLRHPPVVEGEEWRLVVRTMGPVSNGIYCVVSNMEYNRRVSILTGKIALCNPVTRQYKFTNPFPCESNSLLSGLAQKPCRIHYGFGFVEDGYNRRDYKVVVIFSWGSRFSSFLSFVYSLRRCTWRKIIDYERDKRNFREKESSMDKVEYPEITSDLELCPHRFYRGSWHWMAINSDYSCSVLAFDFANDSFKSFGGLGQYNFNDNLGTTDKFVKGAGVFVLKDHLAAIIVPSPCSLIHVWMMMDYGDEGSWTNIYAIHHPNFDRNFTKLVAVYSKLQSDNDDDMNAIESICFEDHNKQMICCDHSGFYEWDLNNISSAVCWNTTGISVFLETLELLTN